MCLRKGGGIKRMNEAIAIMIQNWDKVMAEPLHVIIWLVVFIGGLSLLMLFLFIEGIIDLVKGDWPVHF